MQIEKRAGSIYFALSIFEDKNVVILFVASLENWIIWWVNQLDDESGTIIMSVNQEM